MMQHKCLRKQILVEKLITEITAQTQFADGGWEKFEILEPFGQGSSCMTYYAQNASGNYVIIKEFCPEVFQAFRKRDVDGWICMEFPGRISGRRYRAQYEEKKIQFMQEWLEQSRIQQADLSFGTNNPELYVGGPQDTPYIVMNCDGNAMRLKDFKSFLEKKQALGVADILRVVQDYACAIAGVHKQGKLLLDIKPANVLVTSWKDKLFFRRIIDYGSVVSVKEIHEMTAAQQEDGIHLSYTNGFAAPELKSKDAMTGPEYDEIGYCSDIYSFGMAVVQFLTGTVLTPELILYQDDETLKRNLVYMAGENGFLGIEKQSNTFFHLFNIFLSCTLSSKIAAHGTTVICRENVGNLPASDYQKRCNNIEEIILLLDLLIANCMGPQQEPLLLGALQKAKGQAELFKKQNFGMGNPEFFSEKILPIYLDAEGNRKTIFEVIEERKNCYIEAESGWGKTVSLKYAYEKLLKEERITYLPVWISMADFIVSVDINMENGILKQYISQQLFGVSGQSCLENRVYVQLDEWMHDDTLPFRILLLCDGINEIGFRGKSQEIKRELLELAQCENVLLIATGHNQKQELPQFAGNVYSVGRIEMEQAESYLAEKLIGWPRLKQRYLAKGQEHELTKIVGALHSPSMLCYFAAPLWNVEDIPETSLPRDEARIMERYLCSSERCVQQMMQNSIANGAFRPRYGAYFLQTVLGAVCCDMALHGEMHTTREQILRYLAYYLPKVSPQSQTRLIPYNQYETDPIAEQTYTDKILPLQWCTYLFKEQRDYFVIHHEGYRDYLAAAFLADKVKGVGVDVPDEFWGEIPEAVVKYLCLLLEKEDVKKLRKVLLHKYGTFLGRYVKSELRGQETEKVSAFYRKDYEIAGENIARIILHKNMGFSAKEKVFLLARVPREWVKGLDRNKKKSWYLEQMADFYKICHVAEKYLESKSIPRSYGERIVKIMLGRKFIFKDETVSDAVAQVLLEFGLENSSAPYIYELYGLLCKYEGVQEKKKDDLRSTIGALYVLEQLKRANQKGVEAEEVQYVLDEVLIQKISMIAGIALFTGDVRLEVSELMKEMTARKSYVYSAYVNAKEKQRENEDFQWDLTEYFRSSRTSNGEFLEQRDLTELYRQQDILHLLKQTVIVEYDIYVQFGDVADEQRTLALAQLFLMIYYAVSDLEIGHMNALDTPMFLEKRIYECNAVLCKGRKDFVAACSFLGLYNEISGKDFFGTLGHRLTHYKWFYTENLSWKDKLFLVMLVGLAIYSCIFVYESLALLGLMALIVGIILFFRMVNENFLHVLEFLSKKIVEKIFEFIKKISSRKS